KAGHPTNDCGVNAMGLRIIRKSLSPDTVRVLRESILEYEAKQWSRKCEGNFEELNEAFLKKIKEIHQSIADAQHATQVVTYVSGELKKPRNASLHSLEKIAPKTLLELL